MGFEEVKHLISFDSQTAFTNKHSVPTVCRIHPGKNRRLGQSHPLTVGQPSVPGPVDCEAFLGAGCGPDPDSLRSSLPARVLRLSVALRKDCYLDRADVEVMKPSNST